MATYTLTGHVQSGQSGVPLYFGGGTVTLFQATPNGAQRIGSDELIGGTFSITVPSPNTNGIYYATAEWDVVMVVAVIGPTLRGPIIIDEVTTVAAAYAFAQFVEESRISGNAFGMSVAMGMCDNLVSPLTGLPAQVITTPPNANQTNAWQSLCTLANLLGPCLRNFQGARDRLLRLATPPGGTAPADTFQAMVNIARNPASNVEEIYAAAQELQTYTPVLATPPDAWTLAVKVNLTGSDPTRQFGGPANVAWDRKGYAWVANNVFQGGSLSSDFVVVLKPNGAPSDGSDDRPVSPVVGGGVFGTGFGVARGTDGLIWVGSFGWGPKDTWPTEGIVSVFDERGTALTPDGLMEGTMRVQGVTVDQDGNAWLASYQDSKLVVYPRGVAKDWFSWPPQNATPDQTAPGNYTFAIAVRDQEPGVAWVTYSGGLGWPVANEGAIAKFEIQDGALACTFQRPVGKAVKGLALDSQGNAWIASGGDDSVYLLRPSGKLDRFTKNGGCLGPWGIAIDGNDDVWVANFGQMGIDQDYTRAGISKLAGVGSPSGQPEGTGLTPDSGYTLPTGGDEVLLPDGSPLYKDGTPCFSPLMRMTSVTIDAAGNIWAVNNWKPRFATDWEPGSGNPGGDGIVIFLGLARPPVTP